MKNFKDDVEDIVYILNYTTDFREEILRSDVGVKQYLAEEFQKILKENRMQEAIIGNLYYEDQLEIFDRIMHELKATVIGFELNLKGLTWRHDSVYQLNFLKILISVSLFFETGLLVGAFFRVL